MKFSIHKEGYTIILISFLLIAAIEATFILIFPVQSPVHILMYLAGLTLFFLIVRFFRNPQRQAVVDPHTVISGADGKVVVVEEVFEKEYFKDIRQQVSVFMSPMDVHVNWYPVGGKINYYKHTHGSYFIASHPKSSEHNERTTVVVETENNTQVMFRQIAGTVARRIICNSKAGVEVKQGDEMGIIRFGSRFDIFLPLSARIKIKPGQRVKGSETVIATIE